MKPFTHFRPGSLDEALALLREEEGSVLLAGGTDLLGQMKRGLSAPRRLINLKSVPGLNQLHREADGVLSIGAVARLSEVADHPLITTCYPLLSQAIQRTATPQIRNLGTLGGNLCQRPRCWYYRHPDFSCVRKHGDGCFAVSGQNRYHAILGGHRCFIVHPSDTAPALIALDARVEIAHTGGRRELPLHQFFTGPGESLTQETVLTPHEILAEIRLPVPPPGGQGVYLKAAERRAADFALASVALYLARESACARLVLGGIAPVPWRVPQAEALLLGEDLSDQTIRRICEAAVQGAAPLRQNAFKLPLIKGLIKTALLRLREDQGVCSTSRND